MLLNLLGRRKKRAKSETADKEGAEDASKTPQDGEGAKSEGGDQGETAEGEGADEENPEDKQPKTVRRPNNNPRSVALEKEQITD